MTESCFLPNTQLQYALDSTSIGLMKQCPRLYQYTILEGYSSKSESIHLRFGLEYHQALQEYDVSRANGIRHEDAIHDTISALVQRTHDWAPDRESKAGRYKNPETLISLTVDYLDHFSNDPAQTYIREDGRPAVELSFRFELDWGPETQPPPEHTQTIDEISLEPRAVNMIRPDGVVVQIHRRFQPYILCGHLDRVVRFNDQLLVMDRKTTTTTLGSYYFDQYEPNNQMSLYTLAGKVVLDAPIRGVIIDAAQVMLDQPHRFVRGFTYRTPDQTAEWLDDLQILLHTFEGYAQIGHYPMNDTACDKFGGCRFRGICSKDPAVRPRFLKADFTKLEPDERWNPLKVR